MTRIVVNPGYKVRDAALGRDAEAGEILDVPEKEGRVLLAAVMSTETAEAVVTPRRGRYARRDERAEGE